MHISLDSALGRQKRLNSVGESVLQIAPDAAAAYSLRSLTGGDPDVVRVRRESDNTEKDFSGSQIESGEMARWVNEQPTLPLDLRELDTNTGERDGALIEAAAAYSLRKLKEDFTSDVVEVRRNVDGETEGFTADEVTDGTMESFVKGWEEYSLATAKNYTTHSFEEFSSPSSNGFTALNSSAEAFAGWDIPSGSAGDFIEVSFDINIISGTPRVQLRPEYDDRKIRSDKFEIGTSGSYTATLKATGDYSFISFSDGDVPSEFTVSNFKVYNNSVVNELPLDQATGAAAAYSLRSLGTNQWEYAGDTLEYESDFSAGTDGWSPANSTVDGNIDGIGGQGNCLRITASSLNNQLCGVVGNKVNEGSTEYSFSLDFYIPSTNTELDGIQVIANLGSGGATNYSPPRDTWVNISGTTTTTTSNQLRVLGADGGDTTFTHSGGDLLYIRNVKIYESIGDTEYLPSGKYVVQTRRSSDDAVKSFTASEVADGTLEDWVNDYQTELSVARNYTINPYESFTNASSSGFTASNSSGTGFAGFDLSGAPGNEVEVSFELTIRSGSPQIKLRTAYNSSGSASLGTTYTTSGTKTITLTATADFGFIAFSEGDIPSDFDVSNFQIVSRSADGHVKTWYDQSGSDNHAVQTDTAKQPKIVEDGTYLGELDFDGTDELASESSVNIAQLATAFSVVKPENAGANKYIWTIGGTSGIISFLNSNEEAAIAAGAPLVDGTLSTVDDNLKFDFCNTTSSIVAINGSSGTSGTIGTRSGNDVIRIGGRGGADFMFGTIKEIIIYDSDQTDNRRAIEENIANHYDISLAAFSRDGTVSTWYDQSGSTPANHATQTDPTKQPKIVEGGNLLKDSNNKPEIDFDGTDDYFDLTSNIGFQGGGGCVISLQDPQSGASTATLGSASSSRLISFPDDSARWYFTTNAIDVNSSTTVSGLTLFTINHDGTTNEPNVKAFRDGSLMVATTPDPHQGEANTSTVANQIGARRDLTYFSGVLKELIIYTTDQSDNRTAIEANIGETYGITDIPAANDTVNGFVQTWYDQSGESNDAEQISASSQPKIVGEVTSGQPHAFLGGLDFDGVDDELSTSSSFAPDQPITSFIVSNIGNAGSYFSFGASTTDFRFITSSAGLAALNAGTAVTSDVTVTGEETLLTAIGNTTASSIFKNGTSTGSGDIGTAPTGLDEGLKIGNWHIGDRFADGAFKELIIYNSDQSSNRPAIEANINNQYDIY